MGLGYVGSAASAGLSKAGHDVLGLDVDRGRVTDYQQGQVHIIEPDLPELIQSSLANGNLRFSHIDDVSEDLGDAVVIAIGTPPSGNGAADLSQVRAADRTAAGYFLNPFPLNGYSQFPQLGNHSLSPFPPGIT